MGKFQLDKVYDQALNYIQNNADQFVVCQGEPANYSDATTDLGTGSGNALGETSVASGDFTLADGDTSGRKLTTGAQSGITIDVTGDADHKALVNDTDSELLLVDTLTSHDIADIDTANDEVEVDGDQTADYNVNGILRIDGHPTHDGSHTIQSVTYESSPDETHIEVDTDLTDGTAQGIAIAAQKVNSGGDMDTAAFDLEIRDVTRE